MKNNRIAVFTNGYSNEFINHIITGLKKKAAVDGVDIFSFVTYCTAMDSDAQNNCQMNLYLLPDPTFFDGAIILTNTFSYHAEKDRIVKKFREANVPMITLESEIDGISCIRTENYNGFYGMIEHLITAHNVKKITYVHGFKDNEENQIRYQATLDALNKYGLTLFNEMEGNFSFYAPYRELIAKVDENYDMPDAFVCANDHMALGVSSAIHSLGYEIPRDVIVTGFDKCQEGQYTFPLLASVSRDWDTMGEKAYDKLMYQIAHPEEISVDVYDSHFVPSESCGCEPPKEDADFRLKKIRHLYFDDIKSTIMDIFFQRLQLSVSTSERKEDFYTRGAKTIEEAPMFEGDYCICTEPSFFELDDDEYPSRVRGYSKKMDVLYEKRDKKSVPQYTFSSDELYPGYVHVPGQSNHYIFAPLNHMEYIIGYVAIRNSEELLFNQSLRNWIINMNAILFNMRRYIFAYRDNLRLKQIYMTDILTGIYNRTGCSEVLYKLIKEEKSKGKNSILVFADIDKMKTINDVYGHLNGDLAIKATADGFQKFSPGDWLFGRYGGDEFIAVGTCDNLDTVDEQIKNISASMDEYFKSLNLSFPLTASIGYTIIKPEDRGNIQDYIELADNNMYLHKQEKNK